jgi:cytoskeletal protein CcmA (bactofilin family)
MKPINYTTDNKEKERLRANSCSIISGGGEKTIAGDLIVSGKYSGRLTVRGMITLDSNATVTGEIIANEMVIEGRFNGIARVVQKIIFGKTASFSGTFHAMEAEFHKGCTITGRSTVGIIHEKESNQDIPHNYGSVNESIIFSGSDDRVYIVS